MLRGLRGLDLVGGDVVEVSPPFDMSGNTALVGVTMMWEILCLLAESVAKRKGRRRDGAGGPARCAEGIFWRCRGSPAAAGGGGHSPRQDRGGGPGGRP